MKLTGWEDTFDANFTQSHPGDSGIGGNDPQEPVYEWSDGPQEVKEFIRLSIELARQAGRDQAVGYISKRILSFRDIEIADVDGDYEESLGYLADASVDQFNALLESARNPL